MLPLAEATGGVAIETSTTTSENILAEIVASITSLTYTMTPTVAPTCPDTVSIVFDPPSAPGVSTSDLVDFDWTASSSAKVGDVTCTVDVLLDNAELASLDCLVHTGREAGPEPCETVPPVPPPAGGDPAAAQCTVYGKAGNILDGSHTVTCSKCQWQCLTNRICAGISLYGDPTIITMEELFSYNCGDGAWHNGAQLCVLLGKDGKMLDTQAQPCFNCQQQCQAWKQCSGVYYNYQYVAKDALSGMCDC